LKYNQQLERAREGKREIKRFLHLSKDEDSDMLDKRFHQAHDEAFQSIDCLACANCCKTTSPIFLMSDIKRLAEVLDMSVKDFLVKYLTMDEDDDFVLTTAPCPFLATDNTCRVYEHRPDACREYPHTNRKKMQEILDLTYHNSMICPAVSDIVLKLQSLSNE
jgi:Fe-S-cluster containining protein